MSNVIEFPRRVVDISSGAITSATMRTAHGVTSLREEVGRHSYFVTLIDADGTRMSMWDGHEHVAAKAVAAHLADEYSARIKDTTGGQS